MSFFSVNNKETSFLLDFAFLSISIICWISMRAIQKIAFRYLKNIKTKILYYLVFIAQWIVSAILTVVLTDNLFKQDFYKSTIGTGKIIECVAILFTFYGSVLIVGLVLNRVFSNRSGDFMHMKKSDCQ